VLLAHSARWGEAYDLLAAALESAVEPRRIREHVARYLGYGSIDATRVAECTPCRVTALGGGRIGAKESHIHRFPLPQSLSRQSGWRELTITLAWFTPINVNHQLYRRADLWFEAPDDKGRGQLLVERREADYRAVQRGTLQHEIFDGDQAKDFLDDANVEVHVGCRADAGKLEDVVPYAVAVTLEVAPEIGIEIYEEIRTRVHAQVEIAESQ